MEMVFRCLLAVPLLPGLRFYPILASFFRIMQFDYPAIMRLINILSFMIIIFSSSITILKITKSSLLAIVNATIVIFSKPYFIY
jgi:hypothetical protein